jgi:hypothetical protein
MMRASWCCQTGGPVNQAFEKVGMSYGPHPEPGTEAGKEAARKRKTDTGVDQRENK